MSGLTIVRPGILPAEKEYEGTCSNCGCMVRGKKSLWTVTHCQRDGTTVWVKCPTQGCIRDIYGKEVRVR